MAERPKGSVTCVILSGSPGRSYDRLRHLADSVCEGDDTEIRIVVECDRIARGINNLGEKHATFAVLIGPAVWQGKNFLGAVRQPPLIARQSYELCPSADQFGLALIMHAVRVRRLFAGPPRKIVSFLSSAPQINGDLPGRRVPYLSHRRAS